MASSNTGVPPSWPSETNTTNIRDASFSSYLDPTEENFIRTLVSTTQSLKTTNPSSRPTRVIGDEIDVFRADKYFNGEINQESNIKTAIYLHKDARNCTEKTITSLSKLNLQPRTPSVHSESSWNSQNMLLRPVLKIPSKSKTNIRERKSSFLSSCYCCDDKAVDVEDGDQFSNQGSRRSDNHSYDRGKIMPRTIKTSFDTDEIIRFSKRRTDSNCDLFTFPVLHPFPPSGPHKDDTESDTSSDLFEIDCLSCTGTPTVVPHESRIESDGYEPSEASVDWSVVTASAADFTAVSDTEDQKSTLTSVTDVRVVDHKSRSSEKKSGQKSRNIRVFGGCRSQKAVRVAMNFYKTSADQRKSSDKCQKMQRFPNSPVTRFQAEAKSSAQNGVNRRHSKTLCSASSDLFYI
ncbi:hypothetical protein vseg_019933 [Gypsophila vaccaria]